MTADAIFDAPPVRIKPCRYGPMMYLSNDIYLGRSLDLYGEYCQGEADLFDQMLKPGMVAVDVGANIGAFTVPMAKAVGPEGHVIAFEPQRHVYNMLCGNLALNGLGNVTAHHAGLGRARERMSAPRVDYRAANNFGGVSLTTGTGGDTVPVFAFDMLEPEACHFIKIDVEGMERAVLEGSTQTLARHRPVLYVENDRAEKSPPLIEFLLARNYRLYWHFTQLYNPNNHAGNAENVFPDTSSLNMICAPKEGGLTLQGFREATSPTDWPSDMLR